MEKKLFRIPDPCLGVKKAPDPRIKIVLVTCILILSDSALYETKLNLIPLSADAQLCRLLKKVIEKHTLHLTASVYLRLDWYRKKYKYNVLAQDNADRVRKWTKAAMVVVGINSKIILSSP